MIPVEITNVLLTRGVEKRKSETTPMKGKGKKVKKSGDGKEKEGEGKDEEGGNVKKEEEIIVIE